MTELSWKIDLSTSRCSERVKRMERAGAISGYHARVSPKALGKNLPVFVETTLASQSDRISIQCAASCCTGATCRSTTWYPSDSTAW
jgi:DNA-binding Lrp family transcriptional regulator